ncbi:RuvC-like Holliday junction resolvase [Mycobacterium phage Saguaro]|uniref:RuvC-like resolvase n=1 Tax=Mycobacterium phage Saguaro TaxID=2315616 RepID=A0A386KCH5_9CAUD|nr:RuvC-like Holliday junction resolvase [Mycobacterium phage Saguaro]AYD82004.1 RuvC-like resolvase [Mycobacterium phage Saguaro]
MPRVLGIDTSLTATGLARIDYSGEDSWTIDTATVGAPAPGPDKSKRAMARRVNVLVDKIEGAFDSGMDLVAMESLAYGAKGSSAWVLPWVFGRVIELCERHDKPLVIVGTSQRAKYATGKGTADKDTVMLAAARRWPQADITNNNEADATIVAVIGLHYLGYPLSEPTKAQLEVLAKIET